jgi:hypothetical protein
VQFKLGQRVNVDGYGDGRVCHIDKFWAIVAIEFDEPYGDHNLRKRAFAEEWLPERCRMLDASA